LGYEEESKWHLWGQIECAGYKQVDGMHYENHDISDPVTNDVTIRIVRVLMIMWKTGWENSWILREPSCMVTYGNNVYMKIPEGFNKYYDPLYYILLLLQTIYGLKQSVMVFWQKLLQAFRSMNFMHNKADPCLYYSWTNANLTLWVSLIDDCLVLDEKKGIKK
jgi:hypothetical protein